MKKTYFLILGALFCGTLSCKKFIDVAPPPDILVAEQVFTDDTKATAVVTSIYGSMINGPIGFSNVLTTVYAGLAADELSRFNPGAAHQEFMNNQLSPTNAQVRNIWNSIYKHIYYANAAIEGLEDANRLTPEVKSRLIGESRFLRAFCYFYLVNLWGDVPLVLSTDYRVNAVMPRTASTEVYNAIIQDLAMAKAALPEQVPGSNTTRPGKAAAAALLARTYLYQGAWEKAAAEATGIIQSDTFAPLPAPATVFLANSREALFQLAPTSGFMRETQEMRPLGLPQTILTPHLLSAFEVGDLRKSAWVDSTTYRNTKYYFAAKYRNTATAPHEFYTLLRAAELFLIRSEARAQLLQLTGAAEDLNVVRSRAGLQPVSLQLDQQQLLQAIEQERRVEFFAEWGHRWLDLKRWGGLDTQLGPIKPDWQSTAALFPIPQEELLSNANLVQNPGY